jgi:hypothetical protein
MKKYMQRMFIKKSLIAYFMVVLNYFASSQNYTLNTFDYTWCTSSYPTSYVTGSWSISETSTSGNFGITKNQSAKTIIIDLPTGFEFKTSATTAAITIGPSGTGSDVTSVSFAFTTTTRITVTLTSANQQVETNTLNFNDFEVRATSASSGNMTRNGGTFKIDNATTNPTSSEPFGTFSAAAPFSYSSTAVSQAQNGVTISQYSINNQILQINISGTGSCSSTLTQFNLSTTGTAGTDLTSNISTAKIYYTGSSSTFATTNLYGTLTSPSSSFSITGTQALSSGSNYFWLTYDVPGDANTDASTPLNRLDAQLTSFVLNGSTVSSSFTTPNPTGSRTVIGASFYYSRETGTWNNSSTRWATTDGGATCSCSPNGSGVAVIKHAITLDEDRTVDVVEIRTGASLLNGSLNKNLTINSVLNTYGTGYFSLGCDPLRVLGNVTLSGSGASSNTKEINIDGDLSVGSGTSLSSSTNNKHVYIAGSLTVDGTLTHAATNGDIYMDGGSVTLSGTGTIGTARTFIISAGNKTIPASATFTVSCPFSIQGAYTVTNNGSVSITGNMDATNASSQWTNAAASTLKYGGSSDMFASNGKLDASASTNTVNYNRSSNQTIIRPTSSGQYHHLTLSGSGTKTLDQHISVKGDWISNTDFNANSMSVLLNGTSSQSVSGSFSVPYSSLELDNSTAGSAVVLSTPISVSSILTLSDGHLVTTSTNILTMGASSSITLNSSPQDSSFVKGPMKNTVNVSTSVTKVFPVGKSNSYRRADLTIDQTASTSTEYTAEMFNSSATALGYTLPGTLDRVSRIRYHQIDQSPATGLDAAQVRIYFGCSGTNDEASDATNLRVAKDNGASTWLDLNATTTSSVCSGSYLSGSILSGSFTSFSKFSLANRSGGTNVLPVEFLSLEAIQNNNKVHINWITETELNSDYFLVQRSKDGDLFEDVLKVKAAGNSSSYKKYACVDEHPYEGVWYYRLKQYDFNGGYFFSKMVAVEFLNEAYVTIYPNPTAGDIYIAVNGAQAGSRISVSIKNTLGEEVFACKKEAMCENEMIVPNAKEKFHSGMYVVSILFDNKDYHCALIIK